MGLLDLCGVFLTLTGFGLHFGLKNVLRCCLCVSHATRSCPVRQHSTKACSLPMDRAAVTAAVTLRCRPLCARALVLRALGERTRPCEHVAGLLLVSISLTCAAFCGVIGGY